MPVQIKIDNIWPKPKTFPKDRLKKLDKELTNYLKNKVGPMLVNDFKKTTTGWRTAPTFIAKYSEPYGGARKQVYVYPTGRGKLRWIWIHEGTGPREITPKTNRYPMRFPRHYLPKTTAKGRYGGPGRKYGPVVLAWSVTHSIEPRKFSILIKDKREDKIRSDAIKVVQKVINK